MKERFLTVALFGVAVFSVYAQTPHPGGTPTAAYPEERYHPPADLITDLPHTSSSSQPRETVLPGTRVIQELETSRIKLVEATTHITVPNASTAQEAAEGFLKEHHELFGLEADLSDLELVETRQVGTSTRFNYDQTFGGLPVRFGGLSIVVREDLSIAHAALDIVPISVPQPPEPFDPTNSAEAIAKALEVLNAQNVPNPQAEAQAMIRVIDEIPLVTWRVSFGNQLLIRWEVVINADTLEPVEARDQATID